MKVTTYEEDGELYLRTFLIDTATNENKWKVNSASIARNVDTFIGMPLVLTQDYGHPKWDFSTNIQGNFLNQMRYAIGHIVKLFKDGSKIDAGIKITNAAAKEAIKDGKIPFYTSPRIVHDPRDTEVNDWMGIHLAVVNKPAYGVDKAEFKGACYGQASECMVALKSAKQDEDCGFCVKTALEKLITNNSSQLDSSLDAESELSKLIMVDIPQQTIDPSKFISKDEFDAVNTKLAAFEKANADLKKSYDEQINSINETHRKEQLTAVLSAKISDSKTVEERVKYFMDAKVSAEVVETAYKDHVAPVKKDNVEQFTAPKSASVQTGWFDNQQSLNKRLIK